MIITECEVVGRKRSIMLRIPWGRGAHRILALPKEWLPHGSKTAEIVKVQYDPLSVQPKRDTDGFITGWTGEVELLDVVRRRTDQESEGDSGVQGTP